MDYKESMNSTPQGAGSRLDADTLRKRRPEDFLQLGASVSDSLFYQSVTINPGAIAGGATADVAFTWTSAFDSTPVAWLGNVVSGSNFNKMLLTLHTVATTGGTITVFNPTAGSITPNFVVTAFGLGKS